MTKHKNDATRRVVRIIERNSIGDRIEEGGKIYHYFLSNKQKNALIYLIEETDYFEKLFGNGNWRYFFKILKKHECVDNVIYNDLWEISNIFGSLKYTRR